MAGYGYKNNNRGNFNTYMAMERHMDGNGYRDSISTRPGESFFGLKDTGKHLSNDTEQDLFEKVRMQVIQMGRRRTWGVKLTNGVHDHKANGVQNGKYNNLYGAQGVAQRPRFGSLAGDVSTSRHRE